MKKIYLNLIALLVCLIPTMVWADTVSEADAAGVASSFFASQQSGAQSGLKKALSSAGTSVSPTFELQRVEFAEPLSANDTENLFYVYQNKDGEGWVMVAADDAVQPILAYSDEGTFRTDNMPENLRYWLSGYNEQIRYAIDNKLTATEEASEQWRQLRKASYNSSTMGAKVVDALIQTKWDQTAPYNNLCPGSGTYGSGSTKAATGCVATAMSQVMYYWQWPNQGQGSKSYQPKDVNTGRTSSKYGTQSANFGNTTYDWSNMRTTYTSGYTSAQATAVATLMYHAGVSVEMMYGDYSDGGSGAYTEALNYGDNYVCAQNALWRYFVYNYDSIRSYSRSSYSDNNWHNLLKKELDKHRPIMYSGSGTGGGHSFICDGYTANDYFHYNWGWSGDSDGWFKSNALTLSSGGAGSAGLNFNSGQGIIIGIVPNVTTKFTITYNAGSHATCTTTTQTQATIGQSFTLPNISNLDANWLFLGWSDVEGSRTPNIGVPGDSYTPMRNITLYAVVIQDGYIMYFSTDEEDLTYSNGTHPEWAGHGSCEVDSLREDGIGSGIILPNVISESGWTFQQWLYLSNGSLYIAGVPGDKVYPSGNMVVYGYWTEDGKVYVYNDNTGVEQTSGLSYGWIDQTQDYVATYTAAANYKQLTAANTTVRVEIGGEEVNGLASFDNGVLTITIPALQLIDDVDIYITATEDFEPCSTTDYTYTYTASQGQGTKTFNGKSWTITLAGSTSAQYSNTAERFGARNQRTSSATYVSNDFSDCLLSSISVLCGATRASTIEAWIDNVSLGTKAIAAGTGATTTCTFDNPNLLQGQVKFVITNGSTATQNYLWVKTINISYAQSLQPQPTKIPVEFIQALYINYGTDDDPWYLWQMGIGSFSDDFPWITFFSEASKKTSLIGNHPTLGITGEITSETDTTVAWNASYDLVFSNYSTYTYSGTAYPKYHVYCRWTDDVTGKEYYIDDDVWGLFIDYDEYIETGSVGDSQITPTGDSNPRYYRVNYYQQNVNDNGYTLKESATGQGANGSVVTAERKSYTGFITPAAQTVTLANNNTSTNPAVVNYYYDRRTYPISWVVNGLTVGRDTIRYKATPVYNGTTPFRQSTDEYSFSFTGWSPYVAPISQNATYTAQFAAHVLAIELQELVLRYGKRKRMHLHRLEEMLLEQEPHKRNVPYGDSEQEQRHGRHVHHFQKTVGHVGLVKRVCAARKARDIPHNHGAVSGQYARMRLAVLVHVTKHAGSQPVVPVGKEATHVMQLVRDYGIRRYRTSRAVPVKVVRNAGIDAARKVVREGVLAVHLPDIERSRRSTQEAPHQEQQALVHKGLVEVEHAGQVIARTQRNKPYPHLGRKA